MDKTLPPQINPYWQSQTIFHSTQVNVGGLLTYLCHLQIIVGLIITILTKIVLKRTREHEDGNVLLVKWGNRRLENTRWH